MIVACVILCIVIGVMLFVEIVEKNTNYYLVFFGVFLFIYTVALAIAWHRIPAEEKAKRTRYPLEQITEKQKELEEKIIENQKMLILILENNKKV